MDLYAEILAHYLQQQYAQIIFPEFAAERKRNRPDGMLPRTG